MDDNIRSVVQRVLKIWTHEGIINNNQDSMLVGDGSDPADIHQPHSRVRRALDPDKLGIIWPDQPFDINFNARGEGNVNAVRRRDLCEVPVCATVDIGDGYDMGPGGKGLEDRGRGCGTGGEGESVFCVLERCYTFLELISSSV